MTKIIELKGSVQEWVERNSSQIHIEVLEACERGTLSQEDKVEVVILKTQKGITRFVLDTSQNIVRALTLSQDSFVRQEEYELAARARDCISHWKTKKINNSCQNQ